MCQVFFLNKKTQNRFKWVSLPLAEILHQFKLRAAVGQKEINKSCENGSGGRGNDRKTGLSWLEYIGTWSAGSVLPINTCVPRWSLANLCDRLRSGLFEDTITFAKFRCSVEALLLGCEWSGGRGTLGGGWSGGCGTLRQGCCKWNGGGWSGSTGRDKVGRYSDHTPTGSVPSSSEE